MGVDIARGLAVLGMVGAHLGAPDELRLLDPSSWGALVHGRSSILFALLAGISISLMTGAHRRPEPTDLPRVRLQMVGRGATIFVIGLVMEMLNTPIAIILSFYGVLYLAAIPALRYSVRRLLIIAALLALLGPVLSSLLQVIFQSPSGSGLALALFGVYSAPVWLALMIAGMAIGQLRLSSTAIALKLVGVGVACLLIGYGTAALPAVNDLALSREQGLSSGGFDSSSWMDKESWRPEYRPTQEMNFEGMLCEGEPGAYVSCMSQESIDEATAFENGSLTKDPSGSVGSSSNSFEWYDASLNAWDDYGEMVNAQRLGESALAALTFGQPHSGGTAEIIGSGGFALCVLGVCLLLARPLRWIGIPLAALGSMPLTAYCAHVLSYFIIAGPGGMVVMDHAWSISALCLLVACTVWAVLCGRGPLERLVGRAALALSGTIPKHPEPTSQNFPGH